MEDVKFAYYKDLESKFKAYASTKERAFKLISNACFLNGFEKPVFENIKEIKKSLKSNFNGRNEQREN
jgi:hypothetical protein